MPEDFAGWTWWLEDASLLNTPDEPNWVRPKYITRTAEEEPRLTTEQEIDLISEQIEASEGFDIDWSMFRCHFNYHPVDFDDDEFVDEPEKNVELIKNLSQRSLDGYNQENETGYEFVKPLYANFHMSSGVMLLITFQVKDPVANLTKEFQTRIRHSFVDKTDFVFCRPKSHQQQVSTGEESDSLGDAEKDAKKPRLE